MKNSRARFNRVGGSMDGVAPSATGQQRSWAGRAKPRALTRPFFLAARRLSLAHRFFFPIVADGRPCSHSPYPAEDPGPRARLQMRSLAITSPISFRTLRLYNNRRRCLSLSKPISARCRIAQPNLAASINSSAIPFLHSLATRRLKAKQPTRQNAPRRRCECASECVSWRRFRTRTGFRSRCGFAWASLAAFCCAIAVLMTSESAYATLPDRAELWATCSQRAYPPPDCPLYSEWPEFSSIAPIEIAEQQVWSYPFTVAFKLPVDPAPRATPIRLAASHERGDS